MNKTNTELRLHGADLLRGEQCLVELSVMVHTWQHPRGQGQGQARDINVVAMAMLTSREP